MLILHVPIPLQLHERLWLKAAWQLLCSPPLFSSFSPTLPCCTTAPYSTLFSSALLLMEEGEEERLGFPVWFYSQVPIHGQSSCRSPESHLTSMALDCAPHGAIENPWAHGRGLTVEQAWLQSHALAAKPGTGTEPEQGCSPALHPPYRSIPLRLLRASAPERRVGAQAAQAPAHTQAQGTALSQCPGICSHLAPGSTPLLQGKYPNTTAYRFLLLPSLPNSKLKLDFSNHQIPPGKQRDLGTGDFERKAGRYWSNKSCSSLSSSSAAPRCVTTLGVVRKEHRHCSWQLSQAGTEPWEPNLQTFLGTLSP